MPTVHSITANEANNDEQKLFYVEVSYNEFGDPEKRTIMIDNLGDGITAFVMGWTDSVKVHNPDRFGPEFNEAWIKKFFE